MSVRSSNRPFRNKNSGNSVLNCEPWDPATGQWALGPANAVYCGYNSTSALLPTGLYYPLVVVPLVVVPMDPSLSSTIARRQSVWHPTRYCGEQPNLEVTSSLPIKEVSFVSLTALAHVLDPNKRCMTLLVGLATGTD